MIGCSRKDEAAKISIDNIYKQVNLIFTELKHCKVA